MGFWSLDIMDSSNFLYVFIHRSIRDRLLLASNDSSRCLKWTALALDSVSRAPCDSTIAEEGHLWLLVDPVELSVRVLNDFVFAEPEIDLFLGVLDAVGAVADVAANIL